MKQDDLLVEASVYAMELHAEQIRKGTDIPYITHLWAVASLVGEAGGSEQEMVAALLHDAAEDQGGLETLEEIRLRFGESVAQIVAGCSDTFEQPKPAWKQRKEMYLGHLKHASDSVLLISCADKLHNVRCIVADLRQIGDQVWDKFTGGKMGTLWYYQSLLDVYTSRLPHSQLVEEIERNVRTMHQLAE